MASVGKNNGFSGPARMQNEIQRRQWIPDERDNFISWIRGEFAAANAIIDALCQHLRIAGEPGEYDLVLSSIQQRRSNWSVVLHMQQYFSVADVLFAIQQASWRKQQHMTQFSVSESSSLNAFQGSRSGGSKKPKSWIRDAKKENADAQVYDTASPLQGGGDISGSDKGKQKEDAQRAHADSDRSGSKAKSENSEVHGVFSGEGVYDGLPTQNSFTFSSKEEEDNRRSLVKITRGFTGNELVEGKMINIVEGLELYENVFDSSELSLLVSATEQLRFAGRRHRLKGHTFVVSKRPMKGHGREMLQFGVPISDVTLHDEKNLGKLEDLVEPIPKVFHRVIERLLQWQIMPASTRPDSCVINFFNEGDHLQPHINPAHFERPYCTISLLGECSLVFGRTIILNHHGDYKGPSKVSLTAGSVLLLQGNGADMAKYSICSSAKQRITITFVKVQTRKTGLTNPLPLQSAQWSQPIAQQPTAVASPSASREGRGSRQPPAKNFSVMPTSGVLPVPSHTSQVNQHVPSPGMSPLFPPQGPSGAYPPMTVIPPAWSAVARPTARMLSSGTGVFLPAGGPSCPGQFVSFLQQQQSLSDAHPNGDASFPSSESSSATSCTTSQLSKVRSSAPALPENSEKVVEKLNASSSSEASPVKYDTAVPKSVCNKDMATDFLPQSEANGSRMLKVDNQSYTEIQSRESGNKSN